MPALASAPPPAAKPDRLVSAPSSMFSTHAVPAAIILTFPNVTVNASGNLTLSFLANVESPQVDSRTACLSV